MMKFFKTPSSRQNPHPFILWSSALIFFLLGMAVVFPQFNLPLFTLVAQALDLLDFGFHEIGHLLFGYLGEFIGILGGTLGQFLMPALFLLGTVLTRQPLGTGMFIFWMGQNLVNITPYVADAQSRKLKLVSPIPFPNRPPTHDWNYLLDKMGLLWADQTIANIFYISGVLLMLGAVVYLVTRALRK